MTDRSSARVLDGRALAAQIHAETSQQIQAFAAERGSAPEVRVVLCGNDRASGVYARRILRAAQRVGSCGELIELRADSTTQMVRDTLRAFNDEPRVGGVILQLPLPGDLDARRIIEVLDPSKDLDGIHPHNAGLVARGEEGFAPSCAEAAVQILQRSGIPLAGRPTVVIGRSNVVGKPVALLLIRQDATVTVCHRQTRDLPARVHEAEIVIVAAGVPGLIKGDAIQPGAVVIDCGINVDAAGNVVGDVDLDSVMPVAGVVTPVPGGVGPVTNAVLLNHLARTARAQLDGAVPAAATEIA